MFDKKEEFGANETLSLNNNQLSQELVYDLLEQIEGYADYCHDFKENLL